ncbi:folate family ECF transporter S component [uncultured Anaerococcus sp.]|uniref:folate family ECF transporter S component n=1 Tax=uncultured Anaerococcus sp. TaxID=293428 RepID=UPI00288BC376|nr:folate family ECF transporter S component [uncultured Anaerococcus sp.]
MNKKFSVDSLVKAAMLTALSIIFSRFFGIFITPSIKFSFGHLPLMLAGIILGPLPGALAGLAADLIGVAINAGGTPHLGFTLVSVLTGLIPGLITVYGKRKNISLKGQIGLMVFFVFYICHMFLNTLWLSQLFNNPYKVMLASRFIKVLIDGIINYILLYFIVTKLVPKIK